MTMDVEIDEVIACADLAQKAGALTFELSWSCPHDPAPDDHRCPDVMWKTTIGWRDHRLEVEADSPGESADGAATRLLRDSACRCGRKVTTTELRLDSCRWRREGDRWVPGCNAPPITLPAEVHGDLAASARLAEEIVAARGGVVDDGAEELWLDWHYPDPKIHLQGSLTRAMARGLIEHLEGLLRG